MRKLVSVLPVTTESLEDARYLRPIIDETFRRFELATRGFLGLVRCARCHRRTRCVYRVGERLLGRHCAELES